MSHISPGIAAAAAAALGIGGNSWDCLASVTLVVTLCPSLELRINVASVWIDELYQSTDSSSISHCTAGSRWVYLVMIFRQPHFQCLFAFGILFSKSHFYQLYKKKGKTYRNRSLEAYSQAGCYFTVLYRLKLLQSGAACVRRTHAVCLMMLFWCEVFKALTLEQQHETDCQLLKALSSICYFVVCLYVYMSCTLVCFIFLHIRFLYWNFSRAVFSPLSSLCSDCMTCRALIQFDLI